MSPRSVRPRPEPAPDAAAQYWVWVTTPRYYLDEDGLEREDLDPAVAPDADGWWTCHKNTRAGDLVLMYRTLPRADFAYLIRAESDAYSIADDPDAWEGGWDYGCDYRVLRKFSAPLTLDDVRSDPYLDGWGARGGNFQRRVYGIPPVYWDRLVTRITEQEPRARKLLRGGAPGTAAGIASEEELEDRLAADLSVLVPFGYDLELRGRQRVCEGHGGRLDLLCYDRHCRRYVVIELKNVRAGQNTFGQVAGYVGWAQQRVAGGRRVDGLVIARGFDTRFLAAEAASDRIAHIDLSALGWV